jgi:periplasmic copper chaperone A
MKSFFLALFCAINLYSGGVCAADVTVSDAWARATAPGQTVGGAYLKIQSAQSAHLVGAKSPAAKSVELHQMTMEKDVMKMRQVARLELPAGTAVELKPGSYHLMLMGVKRPLVKGEQIPLELTIEDKGGRRHTVNVKAKVADFGGMSAH